MRLNSDMKSVGAFVVALLVNGGCGNQAVEKPGVSASSAELTVVDCQTKQATCLFSAKAPQDALMCNGDFGTCLMDAAKEFAGVAQATTSCQTAAQQCVITGGPTAIAGCRTKFEACVSGADDADGGVATAPTTGATPGLPGFPGFPGTIPGAGATPGGGRPGLPGLPGFPGTAGAGASFPGFPTGQFMPPGASCFDGLRKCVMAGTPPADCATQARQCLGGMTNTNTGAAGSPFMP